MYAITEKMLAHILFRSAFCLAHSIVRATTDSTKEQCKHIVAKTSAKDCNRKYFMSFIQMTEDESSCYV